MALTDLKSDLSKFRRPIERPIIDTQSVEINRKSNLTPLSDLSDKLTFLSIEERMSEYKLKPDRADVIVPALEIYTYVLNELSAEKISVPKMGLSDGIIYDFYKKEIYNEHVG
ncbi:MAG: hypothetical protein EBS34_08795 [Flavobacteriales bacterium]|nr:hypothetical protein [Flavobacteriales bacterium]